MQKRNVALGIVIVVALLAGAGIWWFLRDDAPDEVDIDTAAESVDEGGADATPVADAAGSWSIDTDTGEFDFESATGTFVGFRIEEELAGIGSTTAVGRTGDVTGSIEIGDGSLQRVDIEVDMTTITTNQSRRDNRVQDALETDSFPTATFALTAPVDLGDDPTDGDTITATAAGDLTIHGVTRAVEVPIEARLVGDTAVVVGSLDIVFSDFDVEVPSSQIVLSVEDNGILELQLLFVKD